MAPLIGPGFSNARAAELHTAGLRKYRDVWHRGAFISADEAQIKFGLQARETWAWQGANAFVKGVWRDLLRRQDTSTAGEWLAIFADHSTQVPSLVCRTEDGFQPRIGTGVHNIPLGVPTFVVRPQSACLAEIPYEDRLALAVRYDERGEDLIQEVIGCIRRVRVVEVKRGPKKTSMLLFYGKTHDLEWDPDRFQWPGGVHFMLFTAKLGRKLLLKRHALPSVVEKKSGGILAPTYKLRWMNTWDKEREKKEAGLLWAIWHMGVAVNAWRGKNQNQLDQCCMICRNGTRETVLHCFWECPAARQTWDWCAAILQRMCLVDQPRSRPTPAHGVSSSIPDLSESGPARSAHRL